MDLTALRVNVSNALKDGGMRAFEYLGETLNPPCVAVVPSEPYIRFPNGDGTLPFGKVAVGVDVLLLAGTQAAKSTAAKCDEMIAQAIGILRPDDGPVFDVRAVSRPRVVIYSDSKFVGSVLTIEEVTEEP